MNKLLSYLPPFLREYEELRCITDSEYPEVEYVNNGIRLVLSNQFIKTLSAEGCERWENILHITPLSNDTLDIRRKRILEKFNAHLPYTKRSVQTKLDAIYGEGNVILSIDYEHYTVNFDIKPNTLQYCSEIIRWSRIIMPANMMLAAVSRMTADDRLRYGILPITVGKKTIGLGFPDCYEKRLYAGVGGVSHGRKTIGLGHPEMAENCAYSGQVHLVTGRKTIGGRK